MSMKSFSSIILIVFFVFSISHSQTWFTDEAVSYGVYHPGQTYSCSWADIDNDGDEDLLVT